MDSVPWYNEKQHANSDRNILESELETGRMFLMAMVENQSQADQTIIRAFP